MALRAVIDSLEGVPETVRGLYTEADGKFVLDLESIEEHPGASAVSKALKVERDALRKAKARAKELEDRYGDLDPDAAREALRLAKEGPKGEDQAKLDEAVSKRITEAQKQWQAKLDATAKERDELNGRLSEVLIDRALTEAATKAGVRATALEDALSRGKRVWRLHEGEPTPFSGENVMFSPKDPNQHLSMDEFFTDLAGKASHLFEESRGGGAVGGTKTVSNGRGIKYISNDPIEMGRNLEGLAKGTVEVRR